MKPRFCLCSVNTHKSNVYCDDDDGGYDDDDDIDDGDQDFV